MVTAPRATALQRLRTVADQTPPDRNRVVDLVRLGALLVVVLGHWVMQGLYVVDGPTGVPTLHREGLLQIAVWTHPFTWVLQVVPLFFLVGGYVNLRSWRSARDAGRGYGCWLADRTGRLTRPVLPLLVVWAVVLPVAGVLVPGEGWLRIAARAAWVPTWFLAVYVVVVALTPWTAGLWRRLGPVSVLLGVVAAGTVDLVSLRLGGGAGLGVGAVNGLLVWGTLHQVGYGWLDGTWRRPGRALGLVVLGAAGALLLVRLGPYAVSLVGVRGFGVDNAFPPRVTLLLVGIGQAGGVLLVERLLARVAAAPRVWLAVVALGSRTMTVYVWHMSALGVLAAASLHLGGAGLQARPGSAGWWWGRPAWFLALAVVTAGLVGMFGRYERVVPTVATSAPRALLEVATACVAIGLLAGLGPVADDGSLRWWLPAGAALALLAVSRRGRRSP